MIVSADKIPQPNKQVAFAYAEGKSFSIPISSKC
jgi:hypothetical protein